MSNLKPCPFCGGKPDVVNGDDYGCSQEEFYVYCNGCLLEFGLYSHFSSEEEAIEAWDRREGEVAK